MIKKEEERKPEENEEDELKEEVEEGTEEEGGSEEEIGKILDTKIEKIVKAIRENPTRKSVSYHNKEAELEKSVLEGDPFLRKIRPFVKLSARMEMFIEDVRAVAQGRLTKTLIKALSEGDDSAGGFTVPEEFNAEVIRYATEAAIVRPRARVFNMTRDTMRTPKLDQNETTDSSKTGQTHFGGIHFQYIEEGAEKQEANPRFGQVVLQAKKLVGLVSASDELLEDSAVNLANYLVTLMGEALAYKEDYEFLRGTGMGRPLGVINAAGTTVVSRNTSSKIVLEDVLGLDKNLPAWADSNAVWLTTKEGREQLVLLGNTTTTTKIQLIYPSLAAGMPITMLGKPLIMTDKLPGVGTKGDIVLGDFSKYYIGDRGPIKVSSSIHDRFKYDETVIRMVKRHDGQPAIDKAFVVLAP